MPELSSVTWGTITEDTSLKTKTKTEHATSTANDSRTTTIIYKNVSTSLDARGFATLNTKVKVPSKITLKDDATLTNVAVRYSINGKDEGVAQNASISSHNVSITKLSSTITAEHTFGLDLTVAAAQKAIAEDGYITGTFTVVYDVYNTKADGYNADLSKNTAKPIATVTETVIVKVEASSLTLKNAESEEVWNTKIASDYKATLPAATEPEEDPTTGPNRPDDQPKTGEVIPMALIGMISLGLAGAYTFKNLCIRRRQRQRRRSKNDFTSTRGG